MNFYNETKKEFIDQIQFYMNDIDNNLKSLNKDKTIGIIICKKDNKFISKRHNIRFYNFKL